MRQAEIDISSKYKDEVNSLEEKIKQKGKDAPTKEEKKAYRAKLKVLEENIDAEIKSMVKEQFSYEIPIAEIQKAGISSTGAEIENELIPLEKEFTPYRIENKLWDVSIKSIKYRTDDDGNTFRLRMTDDILSEPEKFYDIKK